MKRNLKKIISFGLAGMMLLSSITPVFAEVTQNLEVSEEQLPNDNLTEVIYNQKSTFSVTVPKKVVLDATKKSPYTVTVTGDISSDEEINVVPDEAFEMIDTSTVNTKEPVPATVCQDKTQWFFNEFETVGNGEINAPTLSAGNWEGSFFFNIKLNSNYISVNAKNEEGEDLNATATQITGERKDQLLNFLVESGNVNSADDVDALINVKSDDFEGIAETTFDVSNIAQEGEKVIILHFDETKQEWEYIGTETVNAEGKIIGNFTSYSPVAFVKVTEDGNYESIGLQPGLYDANGVMLCTWEESGIDAEKNYSVDNSSSDCRKNKSSGYYVITNKYPTTSKIILPKNITKLGNRVFYNCQKITNVEVPNNITSIGTYAFYMNYKLRNITIGTGVTYINAYAFSNCTQISINYTGTQEQWGKITKGDRWNYQSSMTINYDYTQ